MTKKDKYYIGGFTHLIGGFWEGFFSLFSWEDTVRAHIEGNARKLKEEFPVADVDKQAAKAIRGIWEQVGNNLQWAMDTVEQEIKDGKHGEDARQQWEQEKVKVEDIIDSVDGRE